MRKKKKYAIDEAPPKGERNRGGNCSLRLCKEEKLSEGKEYEARGLVCVRIRGGIKDLLSRG